MGGSGGAERFAVVDRYASFDHCYTYFRDFSGEATRSQLITESNLENACLRLGFYLASWGMYRGSSELLQKSSAALVPLVQYISAIDAELWTLEVPQYTSETIESLLSAYYGLHGVLTKMGVSPTPTLRTKILLGTLGSIPAFDNYFARATGVWAPTPDFLVRLREFYELHSDVLKKQQLSCVSFAGIETTHKYPTAKLLDMVFFQKGYDRSTGRR